MLLIPADDSKVALLLRPSAIVIQLLISDIEQGDGYWRGTTEDVLNLRFNVCVPLLIWDEPRRTLDPPLGDVPLSLFLQQLQDNSTNPSTIPTHLNWNQVNNPKERAPLQGSPRDRQTDTEWLLFGKRNRMKMRIVSLVQSMGFLFSTRHVIQDKNGRERGREKAFLNCPCCSMRFMSQCSGSP